MLFGDASEQWEPNQTEREMEGSCLKQSKALRPPPSMRLDGSMGIGRGFGGVEARVKRR